MARGAALDVRPDDLVRMTLDQVFAAHTRAHPDLVYLTAGGEEYTYGELWNLAGSVATALARRGLKRGDRVTTWLPNGVEWVICACALARLGVVNVLANSRSRAGEVAALVSRSGSRGLIAARPPEADFTAALTGDTPQWTVALEGVGDTAAIAWTELAGTPSDDDAIAEAGAGTGPDDVLYVMFTSGTTGLSKGSMTRHGAALANAFNGGSRMGLTEDDRLLCFVPMSHTFGAVNALLASLTRGFRVDVEPDFAPARVLDQVVAHGITTVYGVPTHYALLAAAYRDGGRTHDLSTLTKGCIAGGTITADLAHALEHDLKIDGLTHIYGMTEVSAFITQSSWDEPFAVRVGTVGRPMPGIELRLVNGETGEETGPGEPGDILIRGFAVHAGYLGMDRDPALRADGWWETGDIGSLDGDGHLTLLGRSKEMYKTSGFNVYPAEVENCLCHHPGVAEAAVVGVPHPVRSEIGVAFVRAAPEAATLDEAGLRAFVRTRLSGYKVPEHVFVVEDFPRSSGTLKIQKHELRAHAAELLSERTDAALR